MTRHLRLLLLLLLLLPLHRAMGQTVRVGVFDHPPLVSVDAFGRPGGVFVAILEEVANHEGWSLEYVPGTWQECLNRLQDGEIDLLITITPTDARRLLFDFTHEPVASTWAQIYAAPQLTLPSLAELDGRKVVGMSGDVHLDAFREATKRLDIRPLISEVDSDLEAFEAVQQGRADALVTEYFAGTRREREFKLTRTPIYLFSHPLAYGTLKGDHNQLLAAIDRWIAGERMAPDSAYQAAIARWLGADYLQGLGVLHGTLPDKPGIQLNDEEREWLAHNPDIRFAAISDQPPVSMPDAYGAPDGLLADLFLLFSRALGRQIHLELHATEKTGGVAGRVPIYGHSTLIRTPDNERRYLLTQPYLTTPFYLITTRAGATRIRGAGDLRGLRVAIPTSHNAISDYLEEVGAQAVLVNSPLEQMQLVTAGKADALIGYLSYPYLMNKYLMGDLTIAFIAKPEVGIHIGIDRRYPILLGIMNKAIAAVDEKEKAELFAKWTRLTAQGATDIHLTEEERGWLADHPTVRVAAHRNRPPVEYLDEADHLQGISADYLDRLEELLGVHFEVTTYPTWQETVAELKSGTVDMHSSLRRTPSRDEYLLFTPPYLRVPIVFFTGPEVSFIGNPRELAGRKVAVVGDMAIAELLALDHPDIELVRVQDTRAGLRLLADGEVYAYAGDLLSTTHAINTFGFTSLKASGDTTYTSEQAMAVPKGIPILSSILRKGLAAIPQEEHERIYQRWVATQRKPHLDYQLIWRMAGTTALLFLLFAYWNRRLSREVARRGKAEAEARSTAEQLRAAEAFARETIDALDAQLCVLDPEGTIITVNRSWREFAENHPPPLPNHGIGTNYLEAAEAAGRMGSDSAQLAASGLRTLLAGEHRRFSLEYPCRLPDGERWYLMTATRFHGTQPVLTVVAHEEITERKHAEEELHRAKEAAEAANRAKSAFLANISHELRTPLNAVLGFSQLLVSEHDIAPQHRDRLCAINRAGDHLLTMINDVLDLSKIEAGKIELQPNLFPWAGMVRDLGEVFQFRANEKGLRFALSIEDASPTTIYADSSKLRQVLINLLSNAIKFTDRGGITLRATLLPQATEVEDRATPGPWLRIEVEDSGTGIPHEQLEQIFEPFYQFDNARNPGREGTGLGLAISRSLIGLMGGRIGVESRAGEGSNFHFEVPIQPATSHAEGEYEQGEVRGLVSAHPEERMLVVDDEPNNRALLSVFLTRAGFQVRQAVNGIEALEVFQQWRPHFIWLDMGMPEMDGYETARRLRSLPGGERVHIAAVTPTPLNTDHERALDAGCDAVVAKPYTPETLYEIMQQWLDTRHRHRGYAPSPSAPWIPWADSFAQLDRGLLQRLLDAVMHLDQERVKQVCQEFREQTPELADGVMSMAERFRFEQLMEMLEQVLAERNGES